MGELLGAIVKICGGAGGGRPNLVQAGGREAAKLPEVLEVAIAQLREGLS
jgi:alanyl-tRNA synthetase